MSSFANVYFKNFIIDSSKGEISPQILQYFQEVELEVKIKRKENEKVEDAQAYFKSTLGNMLDRLQAIGYTSLYNSYFEDHRFDYIESLEGNLKIFNEPDIQRKLEQEIKLFKNGSMKDFDHAVKILIDNRINHFNKEKYTGDNRYCLYLLSQTESIFDGHPGASLSFSDIILTLGRIYPKSLIIKYDISEFIDYNYFHIIYDIYELVIIRENFGHKIGEKIIILTEGSSDIAILQETLNLLYPHLSEFYFFMDFHSSNAPGSTSSLVNTIKSFIGAGIKNRVIALFDNDTAAKEAVTSLSKIEIPETITILHLPEIELANNYPTIGPSGNTDMDVNGLAGSIELYLGKDVISKNGKYIPIQWKGYSQKIEAYQGEILQKEEVQKIFFKMIKECKEDRAKFKKKDWSGLRNIFEAIFHAFDY